MNKHGKPRSLTVHSAEDMQALFDAVTRAIPAARRASARAAKAADAAVTWQDKKARAIHQDSWAAWRREHSLTYLQRRLGDRLGKPEFVDWWKRDDADAAKGEGPPS